MKKRILSLLLCAAMLLTLLPQTVLFASADDSGTCGDNLRWSYNNFTYTLTITGSGEMTDWSIYFDVPWYSYCSSIKSVSLPDGLTSIGNVAFYGCTGLTAISIPDSVTSIGNYAFYKCTGLTSITIPSGVTSIGNYAFRDCTGLTAISIPDSVTSIGNAAFAGCTGLTSITIPSGVTAISDSAFMDCTGLTAISIPDSVTSIGKNTFWNCTGLTAIAIPDGVTYIGEHAFEGCTGLTAITIPSGVTSIGNYAFRGCTGLTAISIPDSVTSIGSYAFKDCTGLTDVYYPGTEEEWNAIYIDDGNDPLANATIHFGQTGTDPIETDSGICGTNLRWSYNSSTYTLTITGSGAMTDWSIYFDVPWYSYCSSIKSVSLPDGLTSIGYVAFYGCTGLTAISIPDSVTSIGWSAFEGCTGLTSITIPSGVTAISDYAFSGCTGLTSITIGNGVTSIGYRAFYNCTGLTAITIPDSVTSIGDSAFSGCTGLTSITVAEGNPVYDSRNNCNAIIETATNTLIAGCKNTVIPDSVTSIGEYAFLGCTGLTAISIPDSVTAISDDAFEDCTGLTSITIPDSVTSIGDDAFYHCTGLTSITIPSGVTSIGGSAFNGCTGLTAIAIPDSVMSIDDGVFAGCTGLTAISIPDSVTSIGDWAFGYCSGLTSVTIGNGVTSIGGYAFCDCTGLTDVYYPGTEEEWNAIYIDDGNDPLTNATIHFGQTEADPCEGYTDINRGSWYHSAADFVISRGLMGSTKTDALTFEPNTKVSRAMVASILYRMAGSPAVEYKATFTDVPADKWFTSAIEWCAQNGLASGKGNGKFDSNGNVTRQELAVFMMKMAEYLGKDTSGRADLGSFADGTSVPSWAKEYVQWAVSAGLISGKGNGGKTYLAPTDTATRAEFASIIMRFVQNIAEAK